MRELTTAEIQGVSGGLSQATGTELIGAIVGAAALTAAAPAAVAFGTGVLLGLALCDVYDEVTS